MGYDYLYVVGEGHKLDDILVIKSRTVCHAKTCENWPGLVNSLVYYACLIHEIYIVLPYSIDFSYTQVTSVWSSLYQ